MLWSAVSGAIERKLWKMTYCSDLAPGEINPGDISLPQWGRRISTDLITVATTRSVSPPCSEESLTA